MNKRNAVIALSLFTLTTGCDIFNRWDAVVYVNKFDMASAIEVGTYDSLETCRAAAVAKLKELSAGELGGYICGENCLVKTGFGPTRMCERTAR